MSAIRLAGAVAALVLAGCGSGVAPTARLDRLNDGQQTRLCDWTLDALAANEDLACPAIWSWRGVHDHESCVETLDQLGDCSVKVVGWEACVGAIVDDLCPAWQTSDECSAVHCPTAP